MPSDNPAPKTLTREQIELFRKVAPAMPEPPSHWPYAEREAWKAGWYAGNQAARKK